MITPQQDYANRLKAWLKREAELRAENERLKLALGESEQLRSAQVDAVSSENERLRESLSQIALSSHTGDMIPLMRNSGREWITASQFAREALSPEQPPSGSKP